MKTKLSLHFIFSFGKAAFRISAAMFLMGNNLFLTAILLMVAEILGIIEEI